MAANESVNSEPTDVETVVNRWLVDYYVSLALELFQKELYADFCDVRTVIDSVLDRPFEDPDDLRLKIQVLKFLSRINEGGNLDVTFGPEDSTSPLESALIFLEQINRETPIPQQDFENVCTSLKEMIVVIFIKNNKFDEAKKVLNTHFPRQMVGKKAIFMGLIRKKSKTHEVIEQSNFQQFKNEMLAFCRRLCPDDATFLHKAAKKLKYIRLTGADEDAAGPGDQDEPGLDDQDEPGPDEHEEPGLSSRPQINTVRYTLGNYSISQRTRLEAAYRELAPELDERTFTQLEEEVEREEQARIQDISLCLSSAPTKDTNRDTEQDGLFQRASGSPMEASPADQPPQMDAVPETQAGSRSKMPSVPKNRRLNTLSRLVVEPDSQQSTPASQELENEVETEESQSPAVPSEKLLQSPLTDSEIAVPTRKRRRRSDRLRGRASTSTAELSADGEEETPVLFNSSICRKSRQLSSDSEEETPSSYRAPGQTPRKQLADDSLSESLTSTPERISDRIGGAPPITQASGRGSSTKSNQVPSDSEEDQQPPVAPCKTPVKKPLRQLANIPPSRDNTDEVCITDSSLDTSPNPFPRQRRLRTSSTPHKDSAQGPSTSKWKTLFNNAKESKEIWDEDEDECFFISEKDSGSHNESNISISGHKKRRWTESETQKLKEGVRKFGEGNWSRIKSYYTFENRTNINLKDRWRTLKKLKMV